MSISILPPYFPYFVYLFVKYSIDILKNIVNKNVKNIVTARELLRYKKQAETQHATKKGCISAIYRKNK